MWHRLRQFTSTPDIVMQPATTDRHHEVLMVAVLLFVLTWVSVGLRVYARGITKKAWGIDNSFMIVTLLGLAELSET